MAQIDKDHGVEHAQLILDTIDQLRKRKARPDKERICHMLLRRHGVSLDCTAADLEKLVDAEIVVKVDYKGNTSYRNAAKWRKSHMGHVLNSNEVQGLIREAVISITGWVDSKPKQILRPHISTQESALDLSGAPALGNNGATQNDGENGNKGNGDDNGDENKLFINVEPIDKLENSQAGLVKQEGLLDQAAGTQQQQVNALTASSQPQPTTTESLLAIKTEQKGATFLDVEQWLRAKDPATSLSGKQLFMALKREVDAGRLAKQPHDGTYNIGNGIPLPKKSSPSKSNKMTVKDLLSPDGEKSSSPGNGKKWNKNGAASPTDKIKKPPKKKVKKSHGEESVGGRSLSESCSLSPSEGVTSGNVGRPRKSLTSSTSSRTPSPTLQPYTTMPRMPSRPIQLSPGGPYIVPNDGELRCDFCLLTAACNRMGLIEQLLFCKDCQAKAHPSCMEYSEDLAARARTSPWQCIDCKTCYICEDAGDPDAMLFCDACDKGYHMDCHNPPVEEKPTGKWVCSKCVLELGMSSSQQMELDMDREMSRDSISTSTTDGPSCLPTPGNSPVPMQEGAPDQNANTVKHNHVRRERILSPVPMMNGHVNPRLPQLSETLPLEVPDASEWSIEDVVGYFLEVGFTEQAEVFKEQEIDGKSLLLMKRSDVLTGLSLKLGPALKIYTHIQRLQTMGNNVL